jgi:hypothetical protein
VDHVAPSREVCAEHYSGELSERHASAIHAAERELWIAAEREHRSATMDHVFEQRRVSPTEAGYQRH